jgi:hypothetical protein
MNCVYSANIFLQVTAIAAGGFYDRGLAIKTAPFVNAE